MTKYRGRYAPQKPTQDQIARGVRMQAPMDKVRGADRCMLCAGESLSKPCPWCGGSGVISVSGENVREG